MLPLEATGAVALSLFLVRGLFRLFERYVHSSSIRLYLQLGIKCSCLRVILWMKMSTRTETYEQYGEVRSGIFRPESLKVSVRLTAEVDVGEL
jgi:hypothetical protein